MATVALSFRREANLSGPSTGAGTTANFVMSLWRSWIASAATGVSWCLSLDVSLMRLVPIFAWSQSTVIHLRSWKHKSTIWEWLATETLWIFVVWLAVVQMLPATDWVKCVSHSGHLLHDRVHREKAQRAESRDWMVSPPAVKKAIRSSTLGMPELADVVANIVGMWPLIVLDLKETGRKDDGDSFIIWSPSLNFIATVSYSCILQLWRLEDKDGCLLRSRTTRLSEVPSFLHAAWNEEVLKFSWHLAFLLPVSNGWNPQNLLGGH